MPTYTYKILSRYMHILTYTYAYLHIPTKGKMVESISNPAQTCRTLADVMQ